MPISMRPFAVMIDPDSAKRLAEPLARQIVAQYGEDKQLQVTFGGRRRSGEENARIASVQAKGGRNPFWFNDVAMKLIKAAMPGTFSKVQSVKQSAMQRIKQAMIVTILDNAKKEQNPDGSAFKPLSNQYALRKQRKFGYVHPVLRATGDLLDDLLVRVVKGGN